MNRFPLPTLGFINSTAALSDSVRTSDRAAPGAARPYGWGPEMSPSNFAREAAAAEARERLLFFDALAGGAF